VSGITFDAGGLIALDRNDRRVIALLARATERGLRITIPATTLAQAMRNPARQARLSRLIRQAGTDLISLDGPDATAVGLLLARCIGRHRRCPRRHLCAEGPADCRHERPRRSQAAGSRASTGGRLTGSVRVDCKQPPSLIGLRAAAAVPLADQRCAEVRKDTACGGGADS